MTKVQVTAKPDHLERLITTPRAGLLELIWNALDADATDVRANLEDNGWGGLLAITVTDNGTGISADTSELEFGALGGSWKRTATTTDGGRALHGKQGRGRFAAYALGEEAQWRSISDSTAGRTETVITGARALPDEFDINSQPSDAPTTGTVVTLTDLPTAALRYVESDRVADDLTAALAIYLLKYHPKVVWRERTLDPESLISSKTDIDVNVDSSDGTFVVPLTIIEWKSKFDRALYLCNEAGVALHQMQPGIQAPGFAFTAYARWNGFAERPHDLVLEGAAPEPIPSAIEAIQSALRSHFKKRSDEKYTRLLQTWKDEHSYPFEGDAVKPTERATRDLFDIVAIAAAPAVEKIDSRSRKFSLRLLKEAIENSPETVHTLMQEVLNLSPDEAEEMRLLIQKTSLSSLISSSKTIADRLEFLSSLEAIINEPEIKKVMKERSQLHRILANETWVFREEYALVGDDHTLRTVLKNNRKLLDDVDMTDDELREEVLDEEGRVRVIDLILSKVMKQPRGHRENLVIELKRPSVHIGTDEIAQIENYAMTVAGDNRFAGTDTRWEFWIIGDNLTTAAKVRSEQAGREPGITLQTASPLNMTIRAVTWAQIIRDAKNRLQFVKESLDYDPSTEAGLDYLRKRHAEYLPEIISGTVEPTQDAPAETQQTDVERPNDAA